MNLTRAAIEKSRITAVVIIMILLAGLLTFRTLPRAEDPGFTIRVATIMTFFPGASPERVEMLVTDKLEKVIQEMPEIDFISSESRTGFSIIFVNIKKSYFNMRPIWDNLRRKVERAVPSLPPGIYGPKVDDEFGDVFGTIVTITGEGYSYAELKETADRVRDDLLRIDEVAKVNITGAQEEHIFVEYNNARLSEFGISPYQLKQILETQNIIIPGGAISSGKERITLEPTGSFESIEELKQTIVQIPGRKETVFLQDLANIHRGYIDPPDTKMKSSGVQCLGLAISLREGGKINILGKKVKTAIEEIQGIYPIGVEFDFVSFQPDVVDETVMDFVKSLIQSILLVLTVMLIFLGFRTGLIVASLIPTSMLMAIFVMQYFDMGFNQMSLAALMIALGMLVDNAIVMSESILVMIQHGKKPVDAAIESAKELRIPLLTSSLTTAAAFLPIYLAESETGEYTAPLFIVVTITLISSWILSLTMVPFFCCKFMKVTVKNKVETFNTGFYKLYRRILITLLKHRLITIAAIIAVFLGVMNLAQFVPQMFFPPKDQALFTATLELPIGTPIEQTESVVTKIEEFIELELKTNKGRSEGVINWATYIGESAPRFYLSYNTVMASPELCVMTINTSSYEIIPGLIKKLEDFCFENFPDLRANIAPLMYGPPVMAPVAVRISGRNPDRIFSIVDDVKNKLMQIPGTKNIKDNWGSRIKKLLVKIDQPRARRAGVTSQDIAISLQTILSGFETTKFREEDKVIPVLLRSVAADRQDIGKIENLNIYSMNTGRAVPLKQVADIEIVWQPSKILRKDRLKTVTVESDLNSGYTAMQINAELIPWLESVKDSWDIGYIYQLGGEIETSQESSDSIGAKLPIAALIIILLLIVQFNSFRKPAIILMTIPLGMIGVILGLLIAGSFFGFMTLLGIISLSGIVINNAIVLLERIKLEIEENGLEPPMAVIEAAQKRLRPILLTTATTMGGLFPLWLGGGPMWEPMAIAIIFGLLFATVLTLGVVPVLYSLLFRINYKGYKY